MYSCTKWSCLFLTTPTQKPLKELFAFLNFHQHAKKSVHSINSLSDTVNFRVLWPDWTHPFLTVPIPKLFDQLLIYANLYRHAKNQAISLIYSGDMGD